MNIERLEQLALWLDAGAPHVIFDMNQGHTSIASYEIYELDKDPDKIEALWIEVNQKGIGACGSVCCIAGYAVEQFSEVACDSGWISIATKALELLDLPRFDAKKWFPHPLFDPNRSPDNCTPQQAAQAVRNCIEDPTCNPWEGVE